MKDDLLIDPERFVRVTHALPDGSTAITVAVVCAYVSVRQHGEYTVAIEVIFDPTVQPPNDLPREAYLCSYERLERMLLPPKDVKQISIIKDVERSSSAQSAAQQETP